MYQFGHLLLNDENKPSHILLQIFNKFAIKWFNRKKRVWDCEDVRLNGAWLAGISPAQQKSPSDWIGKPNPSVCAETRGASIQAAPAPPPNRGTTLHLNPQSELKLTLIHFGISGVEPRASPITDEFREVIGVWKWGVRREWRKAKWCRVEHFYSNLRPCLRTLIQTENRCQRSSSERYFLCGLLFGNSDT